MNFFARKRKILQIGEHAKKQLTRYLRGEVLAMFSKVIYLIDESKEVIWITSQSLPMHRRSLQISDLDLRSYIQVGTHYFIENEIINIGTTVRLDLRNAQVWTSPKHYFSGAVNDQIIIERILLAFSTILDTPSPKGLGIFISNIIDVSMGCISFEYKDRENFIQSNFRGLLKEITKTSIQIDPARVISEAEDLIGLGEGLTPSGDDFFGGLLFCMNFISNYFPGNFDLPEQKRFEELREKTNLISYSIMSDMMKGHGIEPVHQLLQNIFFGGSQNTINENYSQLIRIGNSTGWDILTGIVVGLLTFYFILTKHPQLNEYNENYTQAEIGGM